MLPFFKQKSQTFPRLQPLKSEDFFARLSHLFSTLHLFEFWTGSGVKKKKKWFNVAVLFYWSFLTYDRQPEVVFNPLAAC